MKNRKVLLSFGMVAILLAALKIPLANGAMIFALSATINLITSWYGIALVAALVVIVVSSFIYMLSKMWGSDKAMGWAKSQIFEAIVGVFFIVIFSSFSYLALVNPTPLFSSLGALPPGCTTITSLFDLSSCDISTFSALGFGFFQFFYYVSWLTALVPGAGITAEFPTADSGFGFSTEISSAIPGIIDKVMSVSFTVTLALLALNFIQIYIIAAAPLFLGLFVGIGIIAWIFGISRSFGGAMIAFGLALGIIYPLLVSVTYGFIDTQLMGAIGATSIADIGNAFVIMLESVGTIIASLITQLFTGNLAFANIWLQDGYIIAGLTFIPFLNFIVLEAFVVDFSKVMGEQMSFMALLGNLV